MRYDPRRKICLNSKLYNDDNTRGGAHEFDGDQDPSFKIWTTSFDDVLMDALNVAPHEEVKSRSARLAEKKQLEKEQEELMVQQLAREQAERDAETKLAKLEKEQEEKRKKKSEAAKRAWETRKAAEQARTTPSKKGALTTPMRRSGQRVTFNIEDEEEDDGILESWQKVSRKIIQ